MHPEILKFYKSLYDNIRYDATCVTGHSLKNKGFFYLSTKNSDMVDKYYFQTDNGVWHDEKEMLKIIKLLAFI